MTQVLKVLKVDGKYVPLDSIGATLPKKQKSTLTNEEAEAMLEQLSDHYGQPVRPVGKYCEKLMAWARILRKGDYYPESTKTAIATLQMGILKSNFLWRILYLDEPIRTEKCPKHKGTWSGIGSCTYGCDMTGWLKTPEMVSAALVRYREAFDVTDEEVLEFVKSYKKPAKNDEYSRDKTGNLWTLEGKYKLFCEWATHLGHGEIVPEKDRG